MAPDRHLSTAQSDDGVRPGQRRGRDRGGFDLAVRLACAALALLLNAGPAFAQQETAPVTELPPGFSLGSVPSTIEIPRIGTRATIVPLGLDDNGAMAAPEDPDTVGWWQDGPGVGGWGNMLLDGHVDWGGQLRVFGRLRQLAPGDQIDVTDSDGLTRSYRVEWTRLYDANTAPLEEIFSTSLDEQLTLITCGGEFDHSIHMYLSRWVVRAAPIAVSAN